MSNLTTIKKVENAVWMEDGKGQPYIRIDRIRYSYPFVGNKAEDKDDDGNDQPKWRVVAMLPKESHLAAKNLVKEVIQKLIAEQTKKDPKIKVPVANWFLTDGDEKEDEQMHGHWLVSASDGKFRPKARNARGEVLTDPDEIDEIFFAGSWGSVLIRPWYFGGTSKRNPKKPLAKRIVAGLAGVMFWKKGEPFGAGRVDDDDAWGDVDTSGSDDGEGDGMENDDDI